MAMEIGENGKPMSEATCYKKLQSLQDKGCLEILDSTRSGTKLRLRLPSEIPGIMPAAKASASSNFDFFSDAKGRAQIFAREQHRCFYCRRDLDAANRLIEHVRSRPDGDNSYRNVVAAYRACNNRKGEMAASDFIRSLYRSGLLSQEELEDRIKALSQLQEGELKPVVDGSG
jgi:hypothetical protein